MAKKSYSPFLKCTHFLFICFPHQKLRIIAQKISLEEIRDSALICSFVNVLCDNKNKFRTKVFNWKNYYDLIVYNVIVL